MNKLEHALDDVLARVDSTEAAVGPRFPIYADPDSGEWITSRRGSWVSGFWVGQLWLRARLTRETTHLRAAREAAARSALSTRSDTVTRGLIFWYGDAAGERLGFAPERPLPCVLSATAAGARTGSAARTAAERLCATVDPGTGILPWGTAFGDPADEITARVDGLAGTIPLLAWAGAPAVAERFLRGYLDIAGAPPRRGPTGACSDTATGNRLSESAPAAFVKTAGGWRARSSPPPGWSRGRAWLLLALADAGYWLDSAFTDYAHSSAEHAPNPPVVPAAITGATAVDTSAAAITAVALCKLGRTREAEALISELVTEHLARTGPRGRLLRGCYDLPGGVAVAHELIWGDYFLLLALAIVLGAVSPTLI